MKVWYVTMQFPAPSETFAGVEIKALLRRGADVEVHALRSLKVVNKTLLDEWGIENLVMTHSTCKTFFKGLAAMLFNLPKLLGMLFWIFRRTISRPAELIKCVVLLPRTFDLFAGIVCTRPDIVHLFWGHYPALLGYLVRRYCPDTRLSIFLGAYDLRQGFPCSADVARSADIVWTHVRYNMDTIKAFGVPAAKIRLNYRGIDLSSIPAPDGPRVDGRIVTAGRLLPFKGMDDVLRVFHAVHKELPEVSLEILGDGPEREYLASLARQLGIHEAVSLNGRVSHHEVFECMQRAEVFLFLSKDERLPNVVKEAMACGCLCVVTPTPGINELVRSEENGYVVADNVGQLAKQVIDFFQSRSAASILIERGAQTVRDRFDVDKNINNYLTAWQEACHEQRKQF